MVLPELKGNAGDHDAGDHGLPVGDIPGLLTTDADRLRGSHNDEQDVAAPYSTQRTAARSTRQGVSLARRCEYGFIDSRLLGSRGLAPGRRRDASRDLGASVPALGLALGARPRVSWRVSSDWLIGFGKGHRCCLPAMETASAPPLS
jgi:hypothetical protein